MSEWSSAYGYHVARQISGERIAIRGNTYKYREFIKSLGGRYDRFTKQWTVTMPRNNQRCANILYELTAGGCVWQRV